MRIIRNTTGDKITASNPAVFLSLSDLTIVTFRPDIIIANKKTMRVMKKLNHGLQKEFND